MLSSITRLAFRISRPRFWLYLGGTYLIGFAIGLTTVSQFLSPFFAFHLLFFIFPANIFLYGVNDYYDEDTDIFNPKKDDKEYRVTVKDKRNLKLLILISFIYGLILIIFQPDNIARILFSIFLLLSFLYSAKPIRFKARPFIDFLSNFLYVIPAILAFYQLRLFLPPVLPLFAAFMWTSAMHLFSAVPDIEADKQANITTTAVLIGAIPSLVLCFAFWLTFAIILVVITPWNAPWNFLMFVYPLIPLYLLLRRNANIERTYWLFPYWNAIFGLILFFTITIPKFFIP
ncbi:MAG: prenyltransferase [Candidatus Hermodarchaeota archaeon]